ncbi:hypothetical protein PJ985_22015 [Streptomyces sp. ACA25]|uniref:hypothetical protein n=1 Tax=Streptomyces sp. ACA25 TaxID=3022596 RepID=UPI002307C7E5|nr:hypothetical protein [Streptomyces sp. ACA25]MDB1090231.1 hypothetical protein [Streptomyces sp. ACA25]
MAALGCAALLTTVTAGCQLTQSVRAGSDVRSAVDELMSRDAVTVDATLHASADEVYAYLLQSAEQTGAPEPNRRDARMLSELELTAVVGDAEQNNRMRDLDRTDPLDCALSVGFGGKDAVGAKAIDGEMFVRVGADTVVKDVLREDEPGVARAERFMERAAELPAALDNASRALQGSWVQVDPHHYDAYAAALSETGGVPREMADNVAEALGEATGLLDPQAQWDFVDGLGKALRSGASLKQREPERGAERYDLRLPAGRAHEALDPLLTLLTRQSERFELPPVVQDPVDPEAKVTAELAIRNGVLSDVTFDLGQFGEPGAAALPLRLDVTGGAAISLNRPPTEGVLQAEDLTVALLYLELRDRQRREDPDRGNIPGPLQP